MASPQLQRGRCSQTDGYYVITTVTAERRPLFRESALATIMAAEIDLCRLNKAFTPLAWVLMPDHLHLLLQLGKGSLSGCVQALKSRAAKAINVSRGSRGTVWQAGFYDHRVRHDEDLVTQARYIVANPVRAGLVRHIDDYPHWWCRGIERGADW